MEDIILDTARLFPPFPPKDYLYAFKIKKSFENNDSISPLKLPSNSWFQEIEGMVNKDFQDLDHSQEKQFCLGAVFHPHEDDLESLELNEYATCLVKTKNIYGNAFLIYTNGFRRDGNSSEKYHTLLRSELVKKSPVPLSSDAFTVFENGGTKAQNEKDIHLLTEKLFKNIIPKFCQKLVKTQSVKNGNELCKEMHKKGINISLLGFIRNEIKNDPFYDNLVLTDMLVRSIKIYVRAEMRQISHLNESDIIEKAIVPLMNILFIEDDPSHLFFWKYFLKTLIIFKFGESSLKEEEKKIGFDIKTYVQNRKLLTLLKDTIGLIITESKLNAVEESNIGSCEPFKTEDFKLVTKWKSYHNDHGSM